MSSNFLWLTMGRGVHTTDAEKKVILKLKADGLSIKKISQVMNCSKNKVFNAVHSNKIIETRGRKRKTSARFDQLLIRYSKINPFTSANSLKNVLP